MASRGGIGRDVRGVGAEERRAITLLTPEPVPLGPIVEESEWHEELALRERLRQLRRGPTNAYQTNFHRFLTELVWSVDEAAGGEIARFPDDPYIAEVCEYLLTKPLLLFEKSRRVRLTWTVSAFDLWLAAGGQDPRWPALMRSTGHRQVFIISKKEEDADWVIDRRIRIIYEQLLARGIQSQWPGFPTCRFSWTEANWSNGAQIKALPQGPDQVRQFGATAIHYEELAHSSDAKSTLAAALPLLTGKDGMGGHVIGVCTPNVTSHARDIRDDVDEVGRGTHALSGIEWPALRRPVPPQFRQYIQGTLRNLRQPPPGRLLPAWETRAGWFVVQVPWLAVDDYDFAQAVKGQTNGEDIRREYTLDWDASTGKIVLPEFAPHWHVADEVLPFYPDDYLWIGWDVPGVPACIVSQINPYGQWCLLSSLQPKEEDTIGVYDFGAAVADHLRRCYGVPNEMPLKDLKLLHVGDPTGAKLIPRPGEPPQEARSCYEILDRGVKLVIGHDARGEEVYEERPGWGWRVMPGAVGVTDRLEALRARLRMTVGKGLPALVVCPSAKNIIKALSSYQYKELSEGRYSEFPDKSWASHGVDAIAYVATRLNEQPPKKGERRREGRDWASAAATRTRRR